MLMVSLCLCRHARWFVATSWLGHIGKPEASSSYHSPKGFRFRLARRRANALDIPVPKDVSRSMLQGPIIHFGDFHVRYRSNPRFFLRKSMDFEGGLLSNQDLQLQLQHFANWDFLSKSSPTPGHSDQQKPPNSKGQPQHAPTKSSTPPGCGRSYRFGRDLW